jgi:hypothetical protein
MWYFNLQNEQNKNELSTSQCRKLDLRQKIKDTTRGVCLFGTVPPPLKVAHETVDACAREIAEALRTLKPDGVIVYDIQDEKSRSGEERPLPFSQTHEPRVFAQLLIQHSCSCRDEELEPIVYRAIGPDEYENTPETMTKIRNWLSESWDIYGVRNLVLVGGSFSGISLPPHTTATTVHDVATMITNETECDYFLGGVTIPERHRDKGNEHQRLIDKVECGIDYFNSQVVYNADNAIWMLRDYDELCKQRGIRPVRVIFTFAPFGSENTVRFLRWLGVELPEGTVKRVLSRANLKLRVEESIEICWENFRRILDATRRLKLSVPLGVSVECVSKSKMESDGALQLFSILKSEMDAFYSKESSPKAL